MSGDWAPTEEWRRVEPQPWELIQPLTREQAARAYLGMGEPPGGMGPAVPIPARVVEAIAEPPMAAEIDEATRVAFGRSPGWHAATDHDRSEIVRFAKFVGAFGEERRG